VHVVWFKRDLRITDHRPLAAAAARGSVLPLFVAEPELWQQPDMAARHWAFARECLVELRQALAERGQPLVVRQGEVTAVLDRLHHAEPIEALWSHQETGNGWTFARDRRVAAWCRAHGVPWHEQPQFGVIRCLNSRDGWARRWDRFMGETETPAPAALKPVEGIDPGHMPTAGELGLVPDRCRLRQPGGRRAALATLDSFLGARGEPYRRAMSSPLAGATACSRLSPHLAWGSIAMRETAQATWARQRSLKAAPRGTTGGWRASLTSFSGRLHWHCHFMQKLEDQPSLEFENLHKAYDGLRPRESDSRRLDAWMKGETGLPFVDACMRYLHATGWINFRMRAMLMAVASYHLWLDWRAPGEHLARLFTDYEPGIHWPQVQMQSGTTGINTVRIYNPVKQGHDQDPRGQFVRQWVPELADVPDVHLHEPWRWECAGRLLGRRYPEPIVDHIAAARRARELVWGVRRGETFRDHAARLQTMHGSRKSGISNRGKRGRSSGKQVEQLSMLPGDPA